LEDYELGLIVKEREHEKAHAIEVDIQKFISMRSVSVATFGWKASAASPSNNELYQ